MPGNFDMHHERLFFSFIKYQVTHPFNLVQILVAAQDALSLHSVGNLVLGRSPCICTITLKQGKEFLRLEVANNRLNLNSNQRFWSVC